MAGIFAVFGIVIVKIKASLMALALTVLSSFSKIILILWNKNFLKASL